MKRKLSPPALFLACFGAIIGASLSVEAAEINGRLTSSVYGLEQTGESHWQPYLGMNAAASLWRQNNKSIGLHTNLRWRGDFPQSELRHTRTYVYDLYVEFAGYPTGSKIYAGRQFVYSSIGSALIDGVRYKQRFSSTLGLDLYGGAVVEHQSPQKIQSLGDHANLGGRLGFQTSDLKLGLNWLLQRSLGSTARHRVGLDGLWRTRRAELYGRVAYDISAMEMSGAMGRVSFRPGPWVVSGEFDWRKPSIEANSIFSVVGADAYKNVRTEVARKLPRGLTAVAQIHWELMSGEDSWRTMFGLRTGAFMLGWTHRGGYGGMSDGLSGNATVTIDRRVEAYFTTYLAQYKIQRETSDWIDDYSSSVGLVWRPAANLRVRAEGQYLKNAVEASDWRVFLQVTKGFSVGSHDSETER